MKIEEVIALREKLRAQRALLQEQHDVAVEAINMNLQKIDAALLKAYGNAGRLDDIVGAYVSTRDEKEALIERHKAEVANYNQRLQDIEQWCLMHLNAIGAESVRAVTGTVYAKNRVSVTVSDPSDFFNWVREHEAFDMLEARASKPAVETYLASTGELPPGINRRVEKIIGINRPSSKH
jgi:hypothetical protein